MTTPLVEGTLGVLLEVLTERRRQDDRPPRGPAPFASVDDDRLAECLAQLGEAARACRVRHRVPSDDVRHELRAALVQLGAGVVAWIEELDAA